MIIVMILLVVLVVTAILAYLISLVVPVRMGGFLSANRDYINKKMDEDLERLKRYVDGMNDSLRKMMEMEDFLSATNSADCKKGEEKLFYELWIECLDYQMALRRLVDDYKFLEGVTAKVAVAHGLANAFKVMEKVRSGEAEYHFIEIMACPGGCIGGGGQPRPTTEEIRKARISATYEEDENMKLRKSHENPIVTTLYEEFLGSANSHKAHDLLHTHYKKRDRY